jgi:plastocyanin domain-containing protein
MKIFFGLMLALTLSFGGYLIFGGRPGGEETDPEQKENNVTRVDGKQIIEIRAKGGYLPRVTTAQAGIPTTLRINTSGTFDCSSAIRIPSLKVSKNLPASGVTDIDLGTLAPGKIAGNCSMGMYPFEIQVN